ncbi:MAG: outer membrane protein assembly factor BamD [Deltaproteobacteria bacterium]|uniref:Outer membrane protein assembly factor BamD n=1 Tax=Candidatus Zymogenus saltonus TaxID=2844893 RepID=A0A9D8KD46_9DELT|nr:outer membrane protein assembly factor BamD [Candidatus Zymogenus saltonus]
MLNFFRTNTVKTNTIKYMKRKLSITLLPVIIIATLAMLFAASGCGGGDKNVRTSTGEPEPTLDYDLKTAEKLFADEEYEDAAVAYENFIKKHPLNDNVPYALFREGLAYFKSSTDPKRDQTPTEKAAMKFSQLILTYPNSKYTSNSMSYLRLCHERLAEYNYNVGIYYFDREEYNAAIIRFEEVINKYSGFGFDEQSKRYIEESKKRLSELK